LLCDFSSGGISGYEEHDGNEIKFLDFREKFFPNQRDNFLETLERRLLLKCNFEWPKSRKTI
jgi:hypothetical protein